MVSQMFLLVPKDWTAFEKHSQEWVDEIREEKQPQDKVWNISDKNIQEGFQLAVDFRKTLDMVGVVPFFQEPSAVNNTTYDVCTEARPPREVPGKTEDGGQAAGPSSAASWRWQPEEALGSAAEKRNCAEDKKE